jgi:hypothetical protein
MQTDRGHLIPLYKRRTWPRLEPEQPPPPSMASMTACWPFKKTQDADASWSSGAKKKAPPPKKGLNRPYMLVEIAQALYDQNVSVGLRDVHLPSGWHLSPGGCQSLRCLAVGGHGGMRSGDGGLSFCRIYARTQPSPWTRSGRIALPTSPT